MAEYQPLLTHDGRPARKNPDGSFSTEVSITVTDPRLNKGRPTNIPSLWQGVEVDEDTAVKNALASGQKYPSFSSLEAAVAAARRRSAQKGVALDQRSQQNLPSPSAELGRLIRMLAQAQGSQTKRRK